MILLLVLLAYINEVLLTKETWMLVIVHDGSYLQNIQAVLSVVTITARTTGV